MIEFIAGGFLLAKLFGSRDVYVVEQTRYIEPPKPEKKLTKKEIKVVEEIIEEEMKMWDKQIERERKNPSMRMGYTSGL